MSDEVRKVYEKYQHLDALLSNELYMSDNNFSGKLMRDLWLAIKQQSHPAPPPQVVRGEEDDFRGDAVALARLVLRVLGKHALDPRRISHDASVISDLRRLARKLTGEQEGE